MNRERKYRVWDISHKTFLPTDVYALITSDFGAFGIMLKDWDNYKEGEYLYPNSQIQSDFTGLLDKNGKEIYEGDVIKWDDMSKGKYWRFAVVEIHPDILFNCKFINEVNGIKNSANYIFRFGNFIYKDTHNHIEIIGNVYENQNLIN